MLTWDDLKQLIPIRHAFTDSSWWLFDVIFWSVGIWVTCRISWLVAVTFWGDGSELTTTFTRSGDKSGPTKTGDCFRAFKYQSGFGYVFGGTFSALPLLVFGFRFSGDSGSGDESPEDKSVFEFSLPKDGFFDDSRPFDSSGRWRLFGDEGLTGDVGVSGSVTISSSASPFDEFKIFSNLKYKNAKLYNLPSITTASLNLETKWI